MDTNKRIAICIRGELREWDKCKNSVLSTFNGPNYDFYFATWDQTTHDLVDTTEILNVDEDRIRQDFDGRNLISLKLYDTKLHYINEETVGQLMTELWYRCNHEKKVHERLHDFVYDQVVGTRPDMLINFSEGFGNIFDKEFFTLSTDGGISSNSSFYDVFASDRIFVGSSQIMDVVCDSHLHFIHGLGGDNAIVNTVHNTLAHYFMERKIIIDDDTDRIPTLWHARLVRPGYPGTFPFPMTEPDLDILTSHNDNWWEKKCNQQLPLS